MVKKQERIYSEEQLKIKKDLGKALATLDQALTIERATVHHKTRDIIAASNQEFPYVVAAHRTWARGRISRLTLLEHLFKANEKLGKKVEAEYGKLLKILYPDKPPAEEKKG